MAEIPIQHKPQARRSSVWPWVLAALVLVLAVIGYAAYRNHNGVTTAAADTSTAAGEVQNTFAPPTLPNASDSNGLAQDTVRRDSTLPVSPFDTTTPMRRTKPPTKKP